jgi:hypothetical protein
MKTKSNIELQFKPLNGVPLKGGVFNAVVPVNDNFRVSVSYYECFPSGSVGSAPDNYECAIEVGKPDAQYWSLVQIDGTNTWHGGMSLIHDLMEKAAALKFAGEIQIYTRREGPNRTWGHCFYCAEGEDQKFKLDSVKLKYRGKDQWRFTDAKGVAGVDLYEVRPRKDRRGFDLISEALPNYGRFLCYHDPEAAVGYAKFNSRSRPGEVRVFDAAGAMIAAENWPGDFKET